MTAIPTVGTLSEVSVEDLPVDVKNGTGKRRVKVYLRVTSAATTNTLDLATYVSNLADIEGIEYETYDGAVASTSSTWSTTTVTFAGHTGSGVYEGCFTCTLT